MDAVTNVTWTMDWCSSLWLLLFFCYYVGLLFLVGTYSYYMIGTVFPFWDDYDEHKLPFRPNYPPTFTCRFHFKS